MLIEILVILAIIALALFIWRNMAGRRGLTTIAVGSLRGWHTTERVLDDGAFESCQARGVLGGQG